MQLCQFKKNKKELLGVWIMDLQGFFTRKLGDTRFYIKLYIRPLLHSNLIYLAFSENWHCLNQGFLTGILTTVFLALFSALVRHKICGNQLE